MEKGLSDPQDPQDLTIHVNPLGDNLERHLKKHLNQGLEEFSAHITNFPFK